ncbi:MAG: carboxylating nicotinate-nucleotide diphosphorylase [Phaeodactylibacter sp.]|nr:carboxylating nicotinate-nucleotide diphosphorylase [Phaeodactylibacter sp.]MCB9294868.1 carboxylating nicotinate-nucleotide diphosphorylase [Lewinellaceae bacterium]
MIADEQSTKTFLDFFVDNALKEDVGEGDHTSQACIPADARSRARLLIKDPGVLAGVEVARHIFRKVDSTARLDVFFNDGQAVSAGDVGFEVECNTRALLKAERLVLNTMQRMTGIATMSNRFKFEVEDLPVKILDTRKTTPLIRFLEKWAVRLGGCTNYRFGLFDWIMIKDNHIDACGGIQPALERVAAYQKEHGLNLGVTLEVRNLVELYEALETGGFTRLLLDNFEIPLLREAVLTVHGRFETEASGGVNIHTVRQIAQTGVNYISVGALTHSAVSLDLSLKVAR